MTVTTLALLLLFLLPSDNVFIVHDLIRHKSNILYYSTPVSLSYDSETAHVPLPLPEVSTLQHIRIPSKYPTPRQCSTPTSLVGVLRSLHAFPQ